MNITPPHGYRIEHLRKESDDRSGESEVTHYYGIVDEQTGVTVGEVSEEDYDSMWQSYSRKVQEIKLSEDEKSLIVTYFSKDRRSSDGDEITVREIPLPEKNQRLD